MVPTSFNAFNVSSPVASSPLIRSPLIDESEHAGIEIEEDGDVFDDTEPIVSITSTTEKSKDKGKLTSKGKQASKTSSKLPRTGSKTSVTIRKTKKDQ
jgi:hypothetical protein